MKLSIMEYATLGIGAAGTIAFVLEGMWWWSLAYAAVCAAVFIGARLNK